MFTLYLFNVLFLLATWQPLLGPQATLESEFRVMTWNIWRGGREDGEAIGPQRVIDVIMASGADIVAVQETYGSGEILARELGFHLHARGTNVSLLSRFPVVEDISVFQDFKCVGALLKLPNDRHVACYSIWLPYAGEIWKEGTRDTSDVHAMLAACQPSAIELAEMWNAIQDRLSDSKYADVPIIIAGDFNSMSHLDYGEIGLDQYHMVVNWPTSHILLEAGFKDSYRESNPVIHRAEDRTWSPRFPNQEQDRIDFVYYRSQHLLAVESKIIDTHADRFPSDHAAVMSRFLWSEPANSQTFEGRAATYNIRHGAGMDDQIDLLRIGTLLRRLEADFIGLQEVDYRATRSGEVNQAAELGSQLGMHAAFGKFMDFQGGQYGMAILSKHPVINVHSVELPRGNEPRIALAIEARLPGGDSLMVVNVHFDWVRDDRFRFAQAQALTTFLDELSIPYILLGDFNDQRESRTLQLFFERAIEAVKPESATYTFPSIEPRTEIDFIFVSPPSRWKFRETTVIDEQLASDHRPVTTWFQLQSMDGN